MITKTLLIPNTSDLNNQQLHLDPSLHQIKRKKCYEQWVPIASRRDVDLQPVVYCIWNFVNVKGIQ